MPRVPDMVEHEQILAAVRAIEADLTAGRIGSAEATRRINRCRRAVTPRDLWKASGRRAGSRRRSDWSDIRTAVFGMVSLLLLLLLGMWMVTRVIASM
ncbi:MAG TPA: hypothetical protein VIS06_08235 [Mycobacteriales bacterium]